MTFDPIFHAAKAARKVVYAFCRVTNGFHKPQGRLAKRIRLIELGRDPEVQAWANEKRPEGRRGMTADEMKARRAEMLSD